MEFTALVLTAVIASYLLGGVSGSILVSHVLCHDDVRQHGSGNAGSTNTLRTFGAKAGALALLFDLLKTIACFGIGFLAGGRDAGYLCAMVAGLGHCFPVWYQFHGGKGVACAVGMLMVFDWRLFALTAVLFFAVFIPSRMVSLASVTCALWVPLGTWLLRPEKPYWVFALVYCALVIWMHRGNIRRILAGTESRLSLGKRH